MSLVELFLLVFLVSFAVVSIGVILLMLSILREFTKAGAEGKVEAGGVVIVGPVPIVFGTTTRITKVLVVLAIALMIVTLLVYLVLSGVLRVVW
ncbi:MAG: DUF131 domain-containing protein [Desulfurococcaceae archaeon]